MIKKRKHKRFPVTLNAKVISDGKSYEGIIGNVSEEGIMHMVTTFVQTTKGFTPKGTIKLEFKISLDETVNLKGKVMWFLNPSSDNKSLIIGLKIIDPPPEYIEWIKKYD